MQQKIYLHLLIFCGIWSQGIFGTFADEEIKESSDILVRQKRVFNLIPGEDKTVPIKTAPYIVQIRLDNRLHCVGTILSNYVVITIASCVASHALSQYDVSSAAARSSLGNNHVVINVTTKYGNHPHRPNDGVALLTINPPFRYGSTTIYLELHSGPLLPGIHGIVSGWGVNPTGPNPGTCYRRDLRSIKVPIMSHRECVNKYRPHLEISDMDICTYHPQKKCGHNDGGAPLVIDFHLVGIYLWTGVTIGGQEFREYPDVFIMLQHSVYNQWIRTNVENIDLQFRTHHP